jgi:hypothetical protein
MKHPISILNVTAVHGSGCLRALAVAQVGDFEIRGLRVVQQDGQRPYLQWPQLEHAGKYYPMLKTTPELRQQVQTAVLAAWQQPDGKATV